MTAFQRRRPGAGDDAIVERLTRELLALPAEERMTAFAARMMALRNALHAAHPKASKRDLASRGQELGLRILNEITAATHRRQLAELEKKRSR